MAILWSFEILIIFPNFLKCSVWCRAAIPEAALIYPFITNNHTSFHLWLKQKWLNHQKILKFNAHRCLKNFLLLYLSLLTALIVKNTHFFPGLCFILLRNVLNQARKAFNTKFRPQGKDREGSYQVKQIPALFHNLVAQN